MRLLIVESPNKIKKIRGLLPADFQVAASVGHIRDLPSSGGLGVRFAEHEIQPAYVVTKQDVVQKLQAQARRAESVWLATDPDREGEAIAWHIAECLGPERVYQRVAFQSITKKAISEALARPRSIDMKLVDAQQARRVLDRVVGWLVSPVLRLNCGKQARSAGRVQSVALRIVAEREREISAFEKIEYFLLEAHFGPTEQAFLARLSHIAGRELGHRLATAQDAEALRARLEPGPWRVREVERKRLTKNPPPPFTTSTAQQAASVRLKLSPKDSMAALQRLFEGGHITYHRTDSVALAPEAIDEARGLIEAQYGAPFLPPRPRVFQTRNENAQEAHEAIRPTHPAGGPTALSSDRDGRLYALIWERFIACQMAAGQDDTTTYRIISECDPSHLFTAKGVVCAFAGWRVLTRNDATTEGRKTEDDEQGALPAHEVDDLLALAHLDAVKRSTKPPPRYTQASLIKKLEKEGVGRPSTYATIMNTILARGYVQERARKLWATELGLTVNDWLCTHFRADFIEIDYTAHMEADLDRICTGERRWVPVVQQAAGTLLAKAQAVGLGHNPLAGEDGRLPPPDTRIRCPQCEGPMQARRSRYGVFYGCVAYPSCTGTRPGPQQQQKRPPKPPPAPPAGRAEATTIRCPLCQAPMELVMDGDPFYVCTRYPDCRATRLP